MDQSDAGSMGRFPRWTDHMQEAWVYSHDGPVRCRKHGYIRTCAFFKPASSAVNTSLTRSASATCGQTRNGNVGR
eukprot:366685-Pyramimonas_sp.AAC.1